MGFNKRLKFGKLIWCFFLTVYFFHFFKNLFLSSCPNHNVLPTIFFIILACWMIIEYYFTSPFFQSGIVNYSVFWRSLYSLFFYPFLVLVGVDYCYKGFSQLSFLKPVLNIFGLMIFMTGTALRLVTLFLLLANSLSNLSKKPFFKNVKHPRYLATLIQLVSLPLVFSSLLGILLLPVGIYIILKEVEYEERGLDKYFKDSKLPRLFPSFKIFR